MRYSPGFWGMNSSFLRVRVLKICILLFSFRRAVSAAAPSFSCQAKDRKNQHAPGRPTHSGRPKANKFRGSTSVCRSRCPVTGAAAPDYCPLGGVHAGVLSGALHRPHRKGAYSQRPLLSARRAGLILYPIQSHRISVTLIIMGGSEKSRIMQRYICNNTFHCDIYHFVIEYK